MEAKITLVLVGYTMQQVVESTLRRIRLEPRDIFSTGMFGNFRTITYDIYVPKEETINARKDLIDAFTELNYFEPMYMAKDWMTIFIFHKPTIDKSRTRQDLL